MYTETNYGISEAKFTILQHICSYIAQFHCQQISVKT